MSMALADNHRLWRVQAGVRTQQQQNGPHRLPLGKGTTGPLSSGRVAGTSTYFPPLSLWERRQG